jgi:uncharacterized PurR-regulated membrane protein YhhQ (DUF165 family)
MTSQTFNNTNNDINQETKWILGLAMAFVAIYLSADAVACKMIRLGDFIFPLSYTISDIITEIYEPKSAKRITWVTLNLSSIIGYYN